MRLTNEERPETKIFLHIIIFIDVDGHCFACECPLWHKVSRRSYGYPSEGNSVFFFFFLEQTFSIIVSLKDITLCVQTLKEYYSCRREREYYTLCG